MSIVTYDDMKALLQNAVSNVTFTKKNGDDRVMKCTLMAKEIPTEMAPKNIGNPPDEENRDYMNVFDVEAQGWRSFILDSVKYVKTNLNESV